MNFFLMDKKMKFWEGSNFIVLTLNLYPPPPNSFTLQFIYPPTLSVCLQK